MSSFTHERLDVDRVAIEFLLLADQVAAGLPRGRAYLADQLRRAAWSIPLNVAEGAGEFASADKARFYRMARRSGTECAAILHACRVMTLSPEEPSELARSLLDRIVAMLTALVLRLQEPGADAGADAGAGPDQRCVGS
jgi:four helix bundle protein